ncbi:A/G-specific adenine glycosylase [Sinimarinibacterium sp. CAU 1509]|uniref:A/G-specific adenine glycosylase n=1 Tax=Sinimarinibacterium sp. CAU 1509 TaxID=2562283 RepID=UPI0010AD84A2|nr:A/G-specific adenine glycosylase [Sinimarinibacterium sp. CAU 1509]TJY63219.1 A/G-specific adenine glycosylase [Sinimarinibacterium sp. CAU 1509]
MSTFADKLLTWFDQHGRHDLPWQHPREPYRVWLSEVMLQQTQVATVIPYFERFLARFPDVVQLAGAPIDDVLALWAGLGYYARARNLHRCAQTVVERHQGIFPDTLDALTSLPGIGRSTAAAVLAQAFGAREAILDGNVRRVLARYGAVPGWPGDAAVQKKLWALSESLLPHARLADYTQALMDLGATVCTARKPACLLCPVAEDCAARQLDTVDQFPQPRPKRERPQRSARLLLAQDADGALLLERRPPIGIWGSLWCPPLLDDARLASGTWADALLAPDAESLPPLHHAFTHFDLELQPLRVRLHPRPQIAESETRRWVNLSDLDALGLPAPVRKLIERHYRTEPT